MEECELLKLSILVCLLLLAILPSTAGQTDETTPVEQGDEQDPKYELQVAAEHWFNVLVNYWFLFVVIVWTSAFFILVIRKLSKAIRK